jgi:hypothetical protein
LMAPTLSSIAHLVSSVIYHAERRDLSNKKCSRTRRIELNDASIRLLGRLD